MLKTAVPHHSTFDTLKNSHSIAMSAGHSFNLQSWISGNVESSYTWKKILKEIKTSKQCKQRKSCTKNDACLFLEVCNSSIPPTPRNFLTSNDIVTGRLCSIYKHETGNRTIFTSFSLLNISTRKKSATFVWMKLSFGDWIQNSLYPRMLFAICAKFSWNWPSSSIEDLNWPSSFAEDF